MGVYAHQVHAMRCTPMRYTPMRYTPMRYTPMRYTPMKCTPPPRTWKELQSHIYRKEFEEAAKKEYQNVEDRGTFKTVPKTPDIKVIPLTWVFTYRFDTDGYLAKFKARICVRGDLQPKSNKDTYAATLAARTFRALMAITAAYDLEAYQ